MEWRGAIAEMQKQPELEARPRGDCDERSRVAFGGLRNATNGGVVVLVAIAVEYTEHAIVFTQARLSERDDAHRVRASGRGNLDVRAAESVVKSQAPEVIWLGLFSFAHDEHSIVGFPNGSTACVRPGGSTTSVHQFALSLRTGNAPYRPLRYQLSRTSSFRGLKSVRG